MKYMLLAYTNKADWESVDYSSPEFLAMCQFYDDLAKELSETGEFVMTEGLTEPSLAKTVRKVGGEAVAMDGPYAEAKEVLASFAILDCASMDRALEIAARITDAVGDTVEIRPIPDAPPVDL
jgi:hypothetical protein